MTETKTSLPDHTWRRRQAGSYEADTPAGRYFVMRDPDRGGWTVLYPDGEQSERAETMREAMAWAANDATRCA